MSAQPPAPARWADAGLVSGEAVELDVRAARLGSRVLALLIDLLAQLAVALLLAAVLSVVLVSLPWDFVDAALSGALQTVALVLVLVGYPVLMERFVGGRTLGKLAVGLRVVRADGGPVGVGQSLTRALVGVAVEWPGLVLPLLSWVASVTVMLTDPRGRRLGDLVAGTLVVHTRAAGVWRPAPSAVPPLLGWARSLDLTRVDDGLALAVRQYLGRVHQLAEPDRSRLARQLWAEVAAVTSPPPPWAAPEPAYLAAVLAERGRRAAHRLGRTRALTATLWPELAPPQVAVPPQVTATPPVTAPAAAALRPAVPTQPDPVRGQPATAEGSPPTPGALQDARHGR
ncbi:RDD family protein [Micromonospora sp. DR5-3]|uniref:RDD family protein n=1 Tax=unclassified Micromonospora TaxID=2617518 RepID=UPI00210849A3|nr:MULTISPECIES: RDD family protein [unclassified Micromonospora]MCW3814699.1 RDD family protein [Micromonospora sp. DR5-3]